MSLIRMIIKEVFMEDVTFQLDFKRERKKRKLLIYLPKVSVWGTYWENLRER